MSPNKTADKIGRRRTVRQAGGSTVVTIPPEMLEFTEFSEGETVALEAALGGDEIVLSTEDDDAGGEDD